MDFSSFISVNTVAIQRNSLVKYISSTSVGIINLMKITSV